MRKRRHVKLINLKRFINGFATLKPSYTRQMQPNLKMLIKEIEGMV